MTEPTANKSIKSEINASDKYLTSYPNDTSRWEQWQHDYKFGVILIYPPDPIFTIVNKLRAQYDTKSQQSCDAHISLTVPLPGPVTQTAWDELCERMKFIEPFEVRYSTPTSFAGIPGVVLKVEPIDRLKNLVDTLEGSEMFHGAKKRRYFTLLEMRWE